MNVSERPVFTAPWEARTFALTLALRERGVLTGPEWTSIASRAGSRDDGAYYERWLDALQELLVARGLCRAEDLDQGWS